MKAVIYEKKNSPDVLEYRDVDMPIPADDEVLVKVFSVSINAADYRSMKMGMIPKRKIFGADIAGRIEAIGNNVTKFKVGDEVLGDIASCGFGGFAEFTTASESLLILKPKDVTFETAAAIPMASFTALQALRDKGNLQSGQRVLICGAGGGVGTFAVQLAKYYGAEVTAVCGNSNIEIMQELKADHIINYNAEDFTKSTKRYDLILAVNGNNPLTAYKRLLTPSGTFVLVGGALSQVFKAIIFGKAMSLGSKKMRFLAAKANIADLECIMKLVEEGKVKPVIDSRYPLPETAKAMKYLMEGHTHGKVIIEVVKS